MRIDKKVKRRFSSFVEKQKGRNACHIWTGRKDHRGYGVFFAHGIEYKAHRFIWEVICGWDVPPGLELHHRCRNRACVNVKHLKVVTHQENMRLAQEAGAWAGENNSQAKRTEKEIHLIRALCCLAIPKTWISEKLGIPLRSVYYCLEGWQHLEDIPRELLTNGSESP